VRVILKKVSECNFTLVLFIMYHNII
jgi:hypothetical protein